MAKAEPSPFSASPGTHLQPWVLIRMLPFSCVVWSLQLSQFPPWVHPPWDPWPEPIPPLTSPIRNEDQLSWGPLQLRTCIFLDVCPRLSTGKPICFAPVNLEMSFLGVGTWVSERRSRCGGWRDSGAASAEE